MTIFLPAFDDGEDRLTFMAAIRNHLSIFESDREDRRRAHNECSMSIEVKWTLLFGHSEHFRS